MCRVTRSENGMHEIEPETKFFLLNFQLEFSDLFGSGIRIQIGVKMHSGSFQKFTFHIYFYVADLRWPKCDIQEPPNLYSNYFVYAGSEPVRVHASN
jgi:hypothetical protein